MYKNTLKSHVLYKRRHGLDVKNKHPLKIIKGLKNYYKINFY